MRMRLATWLLLFPLLLLVREAPPVNGEPRNASGFSDSSTTTTTTTATTTVVPKAPRLVHSDWAAHLTESPVAAATLDQTASVGRRTDLSVAQTLATVRHEQSGNSPNPRNSTSSNASLTPTRNSTEETPLRRKNVELVTRKPHVVDDDDDDERDKKKRRRKGQKTRTTEPPPQNDGPHQDAQTTWAHLPDRHHQQTWRSDNKSPRDTLTPWGYRVHIQEPQLPDFRKAQLEWGKYWPIHVYLTGGLFALLSVVNLCQLIVKLCAAASSSSSSLLITKGRFVCITVLLLTATSLRATWLLVDPYNAEHTYPAEAAPALADLPLLCIATSFAIVFLSLLNITCVRLTSKNLQNNCVLGVIVTLVCGAALSCDIIAGLYPFRASVHLIAISLFAVWTTLMALSFMYVFKDVNRAARRKHGESLRATFTKLHMDGADQPPKLPRPTICVAVRVSLINALLFLALNGSIIYGLVAIGRVFDVKPRPADPWPWWSQQLVLRMLELTLCTLLAYTAGQGQTESDDRSEDSDAEPKASGCLDRLSCLRSCCCCCCGGVAYRRNDAVHDCESCSDVAYGFRNENFNTSLDFSNVPSAPTNRSHAWSRGHTTAPLTFHGRSEESAANSARSHPRNSILAHPIQALSSLGSGRQSRFATNSTIESSQRHSTILFRDKLRRSAPPTSEPVAEAPPADEDEDEHDDESIRARIGSRVHSIAEEDAMLLSSPFFPRFKRSHCSSLDNSIDVSSDQLSSLGHSGPGGGGGVGGGPGGGAEYMAHHHRRTMAGSTCSSESAANSFDVAFFLNSNPYLTHTQAVAAQREFMERLVRHEQERHMKRTTQEERRRFLEEYERIQDEMQRACAPVDPGLRSISPIVSARSSSTKPTHLQPPGENTRQCIDTQHEINHQINVGRIAQLPSHEREKQRQQQQQQPQQHPHHHHHEQQLQQRQREEQQDRQRRQQQQQLQQQQQQPHQENQQQQQQQRLQQQQQQQSQPHQPPSVHKMSLDLAPSGVVGAMYPSQHSSQTNRAIGHGQRSSSTAADEDITPDSAVYLDLHMSPTDDTRDLHTIHNSFNSLKRASRSFISRINSTFSLSNKSYAPLESADECVTYFGAGTLDKMDRRQRLRAARSADVLASGHGRPRSERGSRDGYDSDDFVYADHDEDDDDDDGDEGGLVVDGGYSGRGRDHGLLQHGDSGLLVEENSQMSSVLCESACQTESLYT